jgi:UDP-GlcNAc3NAcA epimerase
MGFFQQPAKSGYQFMKIVTIIGARPQFIKASPVSKALQQAGHPEFLVHTGQHYDYGMSQVFFEELGLPEPDVNLNVGSGNHGCQTGRMLIGIEEIFLNEKPDWVMVYGDTNSTLAGALAAVKLHIPMAHVEAGLRSFNREMPEEHNRVLTDHCADLLFCPTLTAVDNLAKEGIIRGVHLVGDVMYDAVLHFSIIALQRSTIMADLQLQKKGYLLATVHRPSNTDIPENLRNILAALAQADELVVLPLHPRTRAVVRHMNIDLSDWPSIRVIEPQGYLDMLMLEQNARMILTDSGGMQKEACWLGVPCITMREETEWIETVQSGWNTLTGPDPARIKAAIQSCMPPAAHPAQTEGMPASTRIVRLLEKAQA